MMNKWLIAVGLSLLWGMNLAQAAKVDFLEVNVVQGKIEGLQWDLEFSRIRKVSSGLGVQHVIQLHGAYHRHDWMLFKNDEPVTIAGDGVFTVEMTLGYDKNFVVFEAVGPNGESEKEILLFEGPEWIESVTEGRGEKRLFLFPSIGYSSIQTRQTGIATYSTTALTAKLAVNYRLKPGVWDLGVNGFGTVYQITKSTPINVAYYGVNGRVGYFFKPITANLFLSLYAGWYFSSMQVAGNAFGYQNVNGPQLYPAMRYALNEHNIITSYVKFSPISDTLKFLTLSNREIAGGIGYVHLLSNDQSLGVNLDASNLILVRDGTTVENTSYTFGVQYGF